MVFNLVSFVSSTPFHIGFTTRLYINTPPETTKPDKPSMGPDHFGWTTNKMLAAAGATNCGGEQMVFAWISKNVILMIRVRKRIVLWWFQEVALNSIMGVLWEKRTSRYFQAISPKKKTNHKQTSNFWGMKFHKEKSLAYAKLFGWASTQPEEHPIDIFANFGMSSTHSAGVLLWPTSL